MTGLLAEQSFKRAEYYEEAKRSPSLTRRQSRSSVFCGRGRELGLFTLQNFYMHRSASEHNKGKGKKKKKTSDNFKVLSTNGLILLPVGQQQQQKYYNMLYRPIKFLSSPTINGFQS